MSRTDKTQPYWVGIKSGDLPSEPIHLCASGECDLPPSPAAQDRRADTRCFWRFVYTGKRICGCRMCTSHHECRAERRRSRHETKRELRA